MLIVHAGNRIDTPGRGAVRFPSSQVDTVAARIGRVLDMLRPSGVVSAAAAGADLVVLDQARRGRIPIHIVLPIHEDAFVRESVADQDEVWVALFATVLEHARTDPLSSIDDASFDSDEEWYRDANDHLLQRASEVADGDLMVALTVRPPAGEHPPSVTDDFADRAGRAGLVVVSIDPRPPADG